MSLLLLLAVSALLGAAFTRVAIAVAPRLGLVNAPSPLVLQHTRTVPCVGGEAVLVAAAIVSVSARAAGVVADVAGWNVLAAGAVAFLLLGLWDDFRPLSPAVKFAGQAVAAVGVAAAGLRLPLTGAAAADVALAAFWIVAVVNAANLVDCCDGLLGCVAIVGLVAAGVVHSSLLGVVLPVAGAVGGFLVYNRAPARVFLGDAGSHLLGFVLAAVALESARGLGAWPALPWMAALAGVPLFEVAFLVIVRTRKGLRFWRASPDHFSQRLQKAGLTRTGVDVAATLAAAALAGAGAAIVWLPDAAGAALAAAILVAMTGAGRLLLRWELPHVARPGDVQLAERRRAAAVTAAPG